jgi:hypothetical protein
VISIFNGRSRALGGDGSKDDIYLQVSVRLRKYLRLFKGAKLSVFMNIALHSDKDGWSKLDVDFIRREGGYSRDAIYEALSGLCELQINGFRVLMRDQSRDTDGKFGPNYYLIFPTEEEIAKYETPYLNFGDGSPPTESPPTRKNTESVKNRDGKNPSRQKPESAIPIHVGEPIKGNRGEPHTQQERATGAGVCVDSTHSSRFEEKTLIAYASDPVAGKGIQNPKGWAAKRREDGKADEFVSDWLATKSKPDLNKCPKCKGNGFFVDFADERKGAQRCDHRELLAV